MLVPGRSLGRSLSLCASDGESTKGLLLVENNLLFFKNKKELFLVNLLKDAIDDTDVCVKNLKYREGEREREGDVSCIDIFTVSKRKDW